MQKCGFLLPVWREDEHRRAAPIFSLAAFPTTLLHPLDSWSWSLSTAIEQRLKRGRSRRCQAVSKPLDVIFTQGSFPYYVSGGTSLCFSSQLFATVFYCVLTRPVGAEIAPGTRNQQPNGKAQRLGRCGTSMSLPRAMLQIVPAGVGGGRLEAGGAGGGCPWRK